MSLSITTSNASETQALGKRLASFLTPGMILGFEGPLGAGKTTLIQGICKGLGVKEKAVSPTFVLMHVYQGKIAVYHFDLYRLEPKDFKDLGWEDYLGRDGICLIEWIDRAQGVFPFPHLQITVDYGSEPDARKFTFDARGLELPLLKDSLEDVK